MQHTTVLTCKTGITMSHMQEHHLLLCNNTTVCIQSEAESIAEAAMGEEADGDETEEVDEEDGLKGDTVWDPDHATPWRHRRIPRNTSQLTARQPSRSLLERVRHLSQT